MHQFAIWEYEYVLGSVSWFMRCLKESFYQSRNLIFQANRSLYTLNRSMLNGSVSILVWMYIWYVNTHVHVQG